MTEETAGAPRIKDRIDKVHDESNSRYELASMVVELQEEVAALTAQRDELQKRIGYTAVPSDKTCESPPDAFDIPDFLRRGND